MAPSREKIFELRDKLTHLADAMNRLDSSIPASRRALADACGIKYKSLNSGCDNDGLSVEMQKALANRVGFDRLHPSWIDISIPSTKRHQANAKTPRRDSAVHFKNYLFSHLGISDLVRYRLVPRTPTTAAPEIAAVAVTDYGQTTVEGTDIQVHLESSVRMGYFEDGFGYGFQRFRVQLRFSAGDVIEVSERLGEKGPELLGDVETTCQGTSMNPQWEFAVKKSVFDQTVMTAEKPLIKLKPKELPASLQVDLAVHPHNGSLVSIPPNEMTSKNKERVLERLMMKLMSDDVQSDGSYVMSRQLVEIDYVQNE